MEKPQSINTRRRTCDHDSITGMIEEEDRTLYLIHVWQLVKRQGHSLFAQAASQSLAEITEQIVAILRRQLKDDFLFLISLRDSIRTLRRVDIESADFEMLIGKMDVKRQRLGDLMIDLIYAQEDYIGNCTSSSKIILSKLMKLGVV